MQRKFIVAILLIATTILILWLGIFTGMDNAKATNDHISLISTSTSTPSSTSASSTPSTSSSSNSSASDTFPILVSAIATAALALLTLLLVFATLAVPLVEDRHKKRVERNKIIEAINREYAREIRSDSFIAHFQNLDLGQHLEKANIYVPQILGSYQPSRLAIEPDPALFASQTQVYPDVVLEIVLKQLRNPAISVHDADNVINNSRHIGKLVRFYSALLAWQFWWQLPLVLTHFPVPDLSNRFVIVSGAGGGKTVLLKHLAMKSLTQSRKSLSLPDLPIFVELQAFVASGNRDLLDFASTLWSEKYQFREDKVHFPKEEVHMFLKRALKGGRALLLLDGLDQSGIGETSDLAEASYIQVTDTINRLAKQYPLSPIVVTTRTASYHQRASLKGFAELEVLAFRPEDVKRFVTTWYADSKKQAIDFNFWLRRNSRMQVLTANPLLLTHIVSAYRAESDQLELRAKLYNNSAQMLLCDWNGKRPTWHLQDFKTTYKHQLLENIAWHLHKQGRYYLSKSALLDVITDFLKAPTIDITSDKVPLILAEIVNENGLLKEEVQDWYCFTHFPLQEYFVAQYVARHDSLFILLDHLKDPWWEEVILLYANYTYDTGPLLQKLPRGREGLSHWEDIFHINLILTGNYLANHPLWQGTQGDDVVTRLCNVLEHTRFSFVRQQITEILAKIIKGGPRSSKEILVDLLSNEEVERGLRPDVWSAISKSNAESITVGLYFIVSDKRFERSFRLRILEDISIPGAKDVSLARDLLSLFSEIRIYESGLSDLIFYSIAHSISMLGAGEESIAHGLLNLLPNQKISPVARKAIVTVLEDLKSGMKFVPQRLLLLLSNDQVDKSVREKIAESLGPLCKGDTALAHDLIALLSNVRIDKDVRLIVTYALATSGERSVIPDLQALLFTEELDMDEQINRNLHAGIACALGTLGEKSVAQELVTLLSNEQIEQEVRWHISVALGTLGEKSVAHDLIRLLYQGINQNMFWCIVDALGTLGESSVAPELVGLLRAKHKQLDKEVCREIVAVIGKLGHDSIINDLLDLIAEEQIEDDTSSELALAVGKLGQGKPSLAQELLKRLSDEITNAMDRRLSNIYERYVDALGEMGEKSVVPELVRLLFDKRINISVRRKIADAVSRLSDPSTADVLLDLLYNELTDTDTEICKSLVKTLGMLRRSDIAQDLLDLLADGRLGSSVNEIIAESIGTLGIADESYAYGLLRLLTQTGETQDEKVRKCAVIALGKLAGEQLIDYTFNITYVEALTQLLHSEYADDVYRALWFICRLVGVRVYTREGSSGQEIMIVRWGIECENDDL